MSFTIFILLELLLAHFILRIYFTLWIIGAASFPRLALWKMNLFSQFFINSSLTFLFPVISIITMITIFLPLLLSLMHSILFLFIICCLFLPLFELLLLVLLLSLCFLLLCSITMFYYYVYLFVIELQ